MALIETITDFDLATIDPATAATLEKVEKASFIGAGVRSAYDFIDPLCYASGIVPAVTNPVTPLAIGASVLNLVSGGNPASVVEAFASGIGPAGLIVDGDAGAITLPDDAKFAAAATLFGFGGWIKPLAPPPNTGMILGWLTATSAAGQQYLLSRSSTGDISASIGSTVFTGVPVAQRVAVDEVAHVFAVASISAGSCTLTCYKNGVVVAQSGPGALSGGVLGTPAGSPRIGKGPFANTGRVRIGTIEIVDFSTTGARTPSAYLARAYGDNIGRFS